MTGPAKATPIISKGPVKKTPPSTPPRSTAMLSPEERREKRVQGATEALETIGAAMGFAATLTGNQSLQLDAMAVGLHAENIAPGLADFAEKNSFVAALLDRADAVTGIAGLMTAALPLVYQIMVNHAPRTKRGADGGEIPNEPPAALMQMGVYPPQMLAQNYRAQVDLKVAQAQARMLRETQDAQQEVERLLSESNGNGLTG